MPSRKFKRQIEKQKEFKEKQQKDMENMKNEIAKKKKEKDKERCRQWDEEEKFEFIRKTFPEKLAKNLQTLSVPIIEDHLFKSLYLTGNVGTGKTLYASKLALEMKEHFFKNNQKFAVEFIKFPKLLMLYREAYNSDKKYDNNFELNTEKKIYDYYVGVDLLILDDLGIVKQSDWVLEKMYNILDERNELQGNGKQTIITSNLSLNNFLEIDDWNRRNASRIYEMCQVIDFGSKDLRKEKKNSSK